MATTTGAELSNVPGRTEETDASDTGGNGDDDDDDDMVQCSILWLLNDVCGCFLSRSIGYFGRHTYDTRLLGPDPTPIYGRYTDEK